VRNALRMRPDRIVVGECRGGEALDMLQAMNTGHDGSLTTTHANSPPEAIARIETLALMAGIDLLTGHVHGNVVDRHRSAEFVEFLKTLDDYYPTGKRIRVILDNHSAHISRETGRFLAAVPNRFDFVFTPKHGSWLNLIESFFGKMARTLLRGIRVSSKEELKDRIRRWLDEINQMPVVFRWKYGITAAL